MLTDDFTIGHAALATADGSEGIFIILFDLLIIF
jgi:hypothetical protein